MSVKDLSQGDFTYWKNYNQKDIRCHEEEFIREIQPELMHSLYRGYKDKNYKADLLDPTKLRNHILVVSKIFTAVNTIIPNLMYQMPRVLCTPEQNCDPLAAAAMTATLNKYNRLTKQKLENQKAVLSTYFSGLSWKKTGYHYPVLPSKADPESILSPEEMQQTQQVNEQNFEAVLLSGEIQEAIKKEAPFNSYESPLNVLIDHKGTLRNKRVLTHRLTRSLQDIYDYGKYDPEMVKQMVAEYEGKFGSRFDAREVNFTLNEKIISQRNGFWILVFADEFDKPLYYEKTDLDDFNFTPLEFCNEPDIRYPTSHISVASRSQQWIDEIASRYVEMIGRARRQHYVNQEILAPGQKESFMKNLIGGLIFGKRPATQGDIMEINSSQIIPDIQMIMQMLQNGVMETLGADSQRVTGQSKNKTLGQDQIAAMGTEVRESGMLDKTHDWLVEQNEKMVKILRKHSGAQLDINIMQNDFQDPNIAKQIMGQQKQIPYSFRTEQQPMPLSYFTQDQDMGVTLNVYEAVKPDKKALAAEYDEFVIGYSNPIVQNALLENGKRVRIDLVVEERARLFEYLDASRFIEDLDSMQMAAIQTKQMLMNGGMPKPPAPPTKTSQSEPKPRQGKQPMPHAIEANA